MAEHILSISYDEALLRTREMLLRGKEYVVTSGLGFTAAVELCQNADFDLIILGHSIPDQDKRELMRVFLKHCSCPVLALQRQGETPPEGAHALAFSDDPDSFLRAVHEILRQSQIESGPAN
ncbi:MAG TPA: hypothetical protein VJT08_01080 [Terriglobales bacterium]|nr:hypothetical protein [Terriglobales bacterium]